jgi:hypothetical protein
MTLNPKETAMQRFVRGLAALALVAAGACKKADNQDQAGMMMDDHMAAGSAQYTVVVKSTWTAATHPFEYPAAGAITGPHFSGLIGAPHAAGYSLFRDGAMPTPGLERLSEEGKHAPLDEEIRAAIAAGTAGALVESGPLRDFAESLVVTVTVDSAHPMVSLVAMVAPSPDWFTGVAGVNLMENGAWVAERTLDLYGWDSGGDDGTTYKAPDRDTNPKKPTSRATTPHFVVNGVAVPVGTIRFTRN